MIRDSIARCVTARPVPGIADRVRATPRVIPFGESEVGELIHIMESAIDLVGHDSVSVSANNPILLGVVSEAHCLSNGTSVLFAVAACAFRISL